jgi:hypothetical protein
MDLLGKVNPSGGDGGVREVMEAGVNDDCPNCGQ